MDQNKDEREPTGTIGGGGDKTTEEIAVILNASHMFMIVMTALFYAALFTDFGTDGTMRWVVALTMIIFCDLAFTIIGISLTVAQKRVAISKGNRLVVWLTIPVLSIPAYPDLYAEFIGFFPSDHQIASAALILCALLFIWTWRETIPLWKRANAPKS